MKTSAQRPGRLHNGKSLRVQNQGSPVPTAVGIEVPADASVLTTSEGVNARRFTTRLPVGNANQLTHRPRLKRAE